MKEYTVRPISKGQQILTNDLKVTASDVFTAKMKAQQIFPGAEQYQIIDIDIPGWAAIQREREKSGFGM